MFIFKVWIPSFKISVDNKLPCLKEKRGRGGEIFLEKKLSLAIFVFPFIYVFKSENLNW